MLRAMGALLVLVLAAGGTAASAFTLGAETLYTAHYGVSNPANESAVRAWNLADGSVRWATALPQGVQNLISLRDGKSLVPLLMALSALQVHGNRHDVSPDQVGKLRLTLPAKAVDTVLLVKPAAP